MPEYLAPGVYVEEIATGPRPIEGVSTSTAGFVGGTERGPIDVRLVTSVGEFERIYGKLIDPAISFLPFAVHGFFQNGGTRALVARAFTDASGEIASLATGRFGDLLLTAVGPGDWANRVCVWVDQNEASECDAGAIFSMTIGCFATAEDLPNAGDPDRATALSRAVLVEEFPAISNEPDRPDYAPALLGSGSVLVDGAFQSCPPGALTPGVSMLSGSSAQAQTARPAIEQGLARLADVDLVNILCVPDQGRDVTIAAPMIGQCERLGDRFAVLQGADNWVAPDDFGSNLPPSSLAAVYHPWIRVRGPCSDGTCLVPPTGHVAGVYARVDASRGVHAAPANRVVKGLTSAETGPPLSQQIGRERQEIFNAANVNIIRDFRALGRGVRVYAARTYGADPERKYVNVRRLFLFVEESIDKGTQWVVFEPNDDQTHARVRLLVADFLLGIWRSGGLVGRTADEAFFVKCGRDTMTQDDIDSGRLICLVGVAPVRPAEFVIFRMFQKTREAAA